MKIVAGVLGLGYLLSSVFTEGLLTAYFGMVQLCSAYENSGLILKLGRVYFAHISGMRILKGSCFLFLRSVALPSEMHLFAGLLRFALSLR